MSVFIPRADSQFWKMSVRYLVLIRSLKKTCSRILSDALLLGIK